MLLFIALFIFSSLKIISYISDNKKNKQVQKKLKELVKKKDDKYIVDFNSLKKQNKDTIAYLKVNNTNIDYVVVKAKDNNYYLSHDFNKNYNVSGWVFADYRNKFDGTDKNIIIYGHNTQDGSMFGSLKNTLTEEWQNNKDNHKIILTTENENYIYQVFSTYSIKAEDYYINTNFNNEEEYTEFLNKLKSRSNYKYNVNIDKDDTILTLSSCTISGINRVVLHAKLIIDKK